MRKSSNLVLACGWDELFIADISLQVPQKIWTWKGEESEGMPAYMRNKFLTTDECKPYNRGKQILVTSSGGGVALIEQATGNTLFYASVPNAHSAELLPGGLIVAAASYSIEGNRINLYTADNSNIVVASDSLYGAHGLLWDSRGELLWALGEIELRSYEITKGSTPSFHLIDSYMLPESGGHDLTSTDNRDILCLTTSESVWHFNSGSGEFTLHPLIGTEQRVKSVSYNSISDEIIYVKATEESWWAYYIRFAGSNRVVYLPGEKLYKVRWVQ
jgi:hypothetical protein